MNGQASIYIRQSSSSSSSSSNRIHWRRNRRSLILQGGLLVASGLSTATTGTTTAIASFDAIRTKEDIYGSVPNGANVFAVGTDKYAYQVLLDQLAPNVKENIRNRGREDLAKLKIAILRLKKVLAKLKKGHDEKITIGQQRVAGLNQQDQKFNEIVLSVQKAVDQARANLGPLSKQSDRASTFHFPPAPVTAPAAAPLPAGHQQAVGPVAAAAASQQPAHGHHHHQQQQGDFHMGGMYADL